MRCVSLGSARPSSSLSNLTSLGVHPSNSSKQIFRRAHFDGEHCNPGAFSVVHDSSRKFSAIVVLLSHAIHIWLQITRFHFFIWTVFSDEFGL